METSTQWRVEASDTITNRQNSEVVPYAENKFLAAAPIDSEFAKVCESALAWFHKIHRVAGWSVESHAVAEAHQWIVTIIDPAGRPSTHRISLADGSGHLVQAWLLESYYDFIGRRHPVYHW